MHTKTFALASALAVIAAASACAGSKNAGAGSGSVSISAASHGSGSGSGTGTTPAAAPDPTPLPTGVTVTAVNVAFRELELDDGVCAASSTAGAPRVSTSSSHGPGNGSGDPEHVSSAGGSRESEDPEHVSSAGGSHDSRHARCGGELGPFVAHLDPAALASLAAGKVPQLWTGTLPAGTYTELEAKLCGIDPASLKDPAQAALAASMGGAAVVIEGTAPAPGTETGVVPFTIRVNACAEIERHVRVVVGDQGAVSNLTLHLDVGAWFRDASGAPLAPDTAAGAAAIAARVAAALDLYGDDDHDGRSDD